MHGKFCLSPTDNTDFFALLKILATLGNLSKLNCPRLSQDFSDFLPFRFFALLKILFLLRYKTLSITKFALLLRKNRSTDLHRFLPYGIFLDMKTREHDLFSLRLFSPTNYINFTPYSPSNVFLAHGMHGTHGILLFISHRLHRLK